MEGTRELKSTRLFLRRYCPEDAEVLYEKFGKDPRMYRYSGWNPYASAEMAADTVRNFIASYEKTDFYGWAIEYKGKLIGTIGAYDYQPKKKRIEVGMSIEPASWGKGFATEALSCVLKYLTEQEKIKIVTAWCASENTGSMKAMQKAGMTLTHIRRNALEVDGNKYDQCFFSYFSE